MIAQIRNDAKHAQNSANEARKSLQDVIHSDEIKIQELNRAALVFKQIPNNVQKISEELSVSADSANHSIEKARNGTHTAQENLNAVSGSSQTSARFGQARRRLAERSQEIGKVAKIVGDLAHRTNMIALNASIQAGESGNKGHGFAVIAEEVERLASRAENTNKQISSFNKTIAAEIGEVEHYLQATVGEVSNLSKFAIETGNSHRRIRKIRRTVFESSNKIDFIFERTIRRNRKSVSNLSQINCRNRRFSYRFERIRSKTDEISHIRWKLFNCSLAISNCRTVSTVENLPANQLSQPIIEIIEEKL